MINKMQNKMITHILKGEVLREENLLVKIKTTQDLKRRLKKSKTKSKTNKNHVFEEYKFIATDNTLPNEREESKSNNFTKKKINLFLENDIIKVTENEFVNNPNNLDYGEEHNINSKISQQNELYCKSSKEDAIEIVPERMQKNNNNSNRSELKHKEIRDRSIDINESTNSLRKSLNKSNSRSPKKIGLISLTPITEEKLPIQNNNQFLRRSSEILMMSKNKRSLDKRNTYIPHSNKHSIGIFESDNSKTNSIINFKNDTYNRKNSLFINKRKSQINNLNTGNYQTYKTTLNSNNSTKNRKNTSKDSNNYSEANQKKQNQNFKNFEDDIKKEDYKTKIYNHESEKIVNSINQKNMNSIEFNSKANTFIKNRTKSEYNLSISDKILNINDKERSEFSNDLEKNKNYNSIDNNFNKNDLKNLEKIIEINNSNSNINLNLINSNLEKSEFLKDDNENNRNENNLIISDNVFTNNIQNNEQLNLECLQDPNFIYNTKSNQNKNKKENTFSNHQRIKSGAASVNYKNSRIQTNSRINTSNTEKKADRKANKMSIISPDSLKTDFIKYENESKRKSALFTKRNSENIDFNNKNKAIRYSTVSTSNSKGRSKNNFINLKNAFNTDLNNEGIDLITKNDKNSKENFNKNDIRKSNYNYRENKHSRYYSHSGNYFDNLNFNYKNEFDDEIGNRINNFNSERNTNKYSAQELYKGSSSNIEEIPFIKKSIKEEHLLNSNFETFKENNLYHPDFVNKTSNNNLDRNSEINYNVNNKTREIKPKSTDNFRDLSPIRESEYSQDFYKKRNSFLEKKIDNIDLNNNNEIRINQNIEELKNNKYKINPNYSNTDFRNSNLHGVSQSNLRVDDAISSLNNLYEFKNNKNSNFIYDEVHEKILPITNFVGESYPENLYREDKGFNRRTELFSDRANLNNQRKIEDNESERNINYKSNEFNQSASTIKKITNSNFSNSRIKKSKKKESTFVPWDKVYKDKFREDFKNDLKAAPSMNRKK